MLGSLAGPPDGLNMEAHSAPSYNGFKKCVINIFSFMRIRRNCMNSNKSSNKIILNKVGWKTFYIFLFMRNIYYRVHNLFLIGLHFEILSNRLSSVICHTSVWSIIFELHIIITERVIHGNNNLQNIFPIVQNQALYFM